MIPRYTGAQAQKMTSTAALPAGGYVAQIQSAKVEQYSWGNILAIAYDVTEGEHANHFRKQFEENTDPNRKWKGIFRLTIPNEKSKYFSSEKRTFNNFIYVLEQSNPGFHFDWEEQHLKGKYFGALVRNKEFLSDKGEKISTTECGGCIDVKSIRDGSFTPLKDKRLKDDVISGINTQASGSGDIFDDDDDLPFN